MMTIRERIRNSARALFPARESRDGTFRDRDGWFYDYLTGGGKSVSGEHVNEKTALSIVAYFAAIRNISQDLSVFPLEIRKRRKDGHGSDLIHDHPVARAFNISPNDKDDCNSSNFRAAMMAHALGYHGSFSEIEFSPDGVPQLYLLDPTSVRVMRAGKTAPQPYTGRIFYSVGPSQTILQQSEVFKINGLGFDGITGYVLSQVVRDALGTAMATQNFRAAFYANGLTSQVVFKHPSELKGEALKNFKDSIREHNSGGAANQWNPVVIEEGMDVVTISPDPQKSQMIEASYLDIENACRMMRMPPNKLQHSAKAATYASVYENNADYGIDCLMPWDVQIEQEVNRKLLIGKSNAGMFAKFNMDSRLRADPEKRGAMYQARFNTASITPNEIRAYEDENPMDDEFCDQAFVNQASIPLSLLLKQAEAKLVSPPTAPTPPDDPMNEDLISPEDDPKLRVLRGFAPVLTHTLSDILYSEKDKVQRAARKDNFLEWAGAFYDSGVYHNAARFEPIIRSINLACGLNIDDGVTTGIACEMAQRHKQISLDEIDRAESGLDLEYWVTTRAEKQAASEIVILERVLRGESNG